MSKKHTYEITVTETVEKKYYIEEAASHLAMAKFGALEWADDGSLEPITTEVISRKVGRAVKVAEPDAEKAPRVR